MKKIFLFASLMVCLGICGTHAQEIAFTDPVYDMVKDGHHLYAATKSGVVCYDAEKKSYSVATLPDSLADENLRSVDCKNGEVYVGLYNGHVLKLNGNDYEYVGTVPDKILHKLRLDNDSNLYACARSLYKKTDEGWTQYKLPDSEISSTLSIYDACVDKDGAMWLAGRVLLGGAYRYDGEKISLILEIMGYAISVAADDAGKVWFGSMTKGLYLVENGTQTNNFTMTNSSLKEREIAAICTDADGTMWCGRNYLHHYADGDFTAYPMPADVAINSLVAIDGIVYIGTNSGIYTFANGEISKLKFRTNAIKNTTSVSTQNNGAYTLQGIKLNNDMLRSGNVYIQNGKKIVR